MKHQKRFARPIALLLAAALLAPALLLTACDGAEGGTGAFAASMFLRKTEGTVAVADGEGKEVAPAENLGLYSGCTVGTEAESYAWIDLDSVKLAKLDASSAAAITKEGKNLSIDVTSGRMFFNVTEPLAEDETMEIRTSSLLVGIRGTCGWVAQNAVGILEGAVIVTAGEQSVTVNAGEWAYVTQEGTLTAEAFTPVSIPAFVARELLDDGVLQQTVLQASGLQIPTSYEGWISALEQAHPEWEITHSEMIDFQQDGDPELLIVRIWEGPDSDNNLRQYISAAIYEYRPEGIRWLAQGDWSVNDASAAGCLLVEADGRQFVCYRLQHGTNFSSGYLGSLTAPDGGPDNWGVADRFNGWDGEIHSAQRHDENGFAINNEWEDPDGPVKYTLVRELCARTFAS